MNPPPSNTPAPLTAVIVTYRSQRTLPAAIDAARRCHDAGLMNSVFVDNASPDSTRDLLEPCRAWARVIHNSGNVGFGRGCNRGLEEVRSPLTIFLNPDAALEPDQARALVEFMQRTPRAIICGPAIVEGDDHTLQVAGDRPTPLGVVGRLIPGAPRPRLYPVNPGSEPFRCGWVCGAALVIRTEAARRLGGFDPRFFLYWEETDLCKRVEREGGEVWAVGHAIAQHVGGASSESDATRVGGCIAKHYFQSRFYYMCKHHGWAAAAAADLAEYALLAAGTLKDMLRGRGRDRIMARLQTSPLTPPPMPAPLPTPQVAAT